MDLKRFVTVGILSIFAISTFVLFQNCSKEPVDLSGGGGNGGGGGSTSLGTELKLYIFNGDVGDIYKNIETNSVSVNQPIIMKLYNGGTNPLSCGDIVDCIPDEVFDLDKDCVSEHSELSYENGSAWLYNVNESRCDKGYEHSILGPNLYNANLGSGVWYNIIPAGTLPAGVIFYTSFQNATGKTVKKVVNLTDN